MNGPKTMSLDLYFDENGKLVGIGSFPMNILKESVMDEMWKTFETVRDLLVDAFIHTEK